MAVAKSTPHSLLVGQFPIRRLTRS